MKWYNFETMFRSLKDSLCKFLKSRGIRYELSGAGAGWHFEILCSKDDVSVINNFLDENTISCV